MFLFVCFDVYFSSNWRDRALSVFYLFISLCGALALVLSP